MLDGNFEQHHARPRTMVGIHQNDCDPVNDMGGVNRQRDDPLCWQTHILLQQGCSYGAAVDDATAKRAVQPCKNDMGTEVSHKQPDSTIPCVKQQSLCYASAWR